MRTFSLTAVACLCLPACAFAGGKIKFDVRSEKGGPLACLLYVRDEPGEPVTFGTSRRIDHLAVDGTLELALAAGVYTFDLERGPEFQRHSNQLVVNEGKSHVVPITLRRIADLAALGWYSGDLHNHRNPVDVPLLIRAADLHVAPVITWWNIRSYWRDRSVPDQPLMQLDEGRYIHLLAGEDEREGGALLFFGLDRPLDITAQSREFPSPMTFVEAARQENPQAHLDIEKPFWWDVPLWLAVARPDTIGLANNHMCRSRMYEDEAWGRARDAERLPAPLGNGFWTQEIYYHILNSGLRVPPSAGGASGVLPNPVGYNRVYVHVDGDLTWDKWWEGLRAGRSFVTNGPLLTCTANGQLPGFIFQSAPAEPLSIDVNIELATQDRVPQLEVVRNGEVVQKLPASDLEKQSLTAKLEFTESGWFLVRAITDDPRTFRFASTAPFYVEVGEHPRLISRSSSQFFLDWVNERIARVQAKVSDPDQLSAILKYHEQARDFWTSQLNSANAD